MIATNQLTEKLRDYVLTQVESMAKTNPMIGFTKPLITRAIDKNFSKVTGVLDLISDKDGNVDVENIITEMMDSLMTAQPFTFKTSYVGDIKIGGGLIKFNIPLTNKELVLNQLDLQSFRDIITSK